METPEEAKSIAANELLQSEKRIALRKAQLRQAGPHPWKSMGGKKYLQMSTGGNSLIIKFQQLWICQVGVGLDWNHVIYLV